MKNYPGEDISNQSSTSTQINSTNHKVDDVVKSFYMLPNKGDFMAIKEQQTFPSQEYTSVDNHFQGIQRLSKGDYFVISGGSGKDQIGNLFFVQLKTYKGNSNAQRKINGPIGSNLIQHNHNAGEYPKQDQIVYISKLTKGAEWHIGGLSICGDILSVPTESKKNSTIRFLNVNLPESPTVFPKTIERKGMKAGAVSLIKLSNDRFLCIAFTDSDDKPPRFDFYLSQKNKLVFNENDFFSYPYERLIPSDNETPNLQSIQIIEQSDGKLYLLGAENTKKSAPIINGDNRIFLYLLELDEKTTRDTTPKIETPLITKVGHRSLDSGSNFYNMGAGTGIYVTPNHELALYATHHWRQSKSIRFGEFFPFLTIQNKIAHKTHDIRIELFEHSNFNGDCLRLYGNEINQIGDFGKIFVRGKSFNDKISSMRILLPDNKKIVLWVDIDFMGLSLEFSGTNGLQEIAFLNSVGDQFSSFKMMDI